MPALERARLASLMLLSPAAHLGKLKTWRPEMAKKALKKGKKLSGTKNLRPIQKIS